LLVAKVVTSSDKTKLREVLKDVKIKILYFENNIKVISGRYIQMSEFKMCCACKNEQPICNFGKLKTSKDGYRYDCKNCRKNYRIKNKELIKQRQHEYYLNNKDILTEKNKLYREKNIDKINVQRKEYRNRPDIKEYTKQKIKNIFQLEKKKYVNVEKLI